MITAYHRPRSLEQALELLADPHTPAVPLAGGTSLNQPREGSFAVVDLQALPLRGIEGDTEQVRIGAMATLQQLLDHPGVPEVVRAACRREASFNLRQMATIGGCVAAGGGRSVLLSVLLAGNAMLDLLPGNTQVHLGELLPLRRDRLQHKLITRVTWDLGASVAFATVEKTPADLPQAGVAMARWSSGRLRACLFGFGPHPQVVVDGKGAEGIPAAIKSACSGSGENPVELEYRQAVSGVLARRCLEQLGLEA